MNIGTYNILNPYFAVRYNTPEGLTYGKDNWEKRKEIVASNIEKSGAAILCFQEVKNSTLSDLKKLTPSYVFLKPAMHRVSHPKAAHGVTIAYNPSKVSLIRSKIFYSYPYEYYNADFRGEIFADFYDATTQRTFRVASTHLLWFDSNDKNSEKTASAKQEGLNQLIAVCNEVEKDSEDIDYLIIAGDLNEGLENCSSQTSRPRYLFRDRNYCWDRSTTPTDKNTLRKIDWIFFKHCKFSVNKDKSFLQPLAYEDQNMDGSDHTLTGTKIILSPLNPDIKRSPRLKGFSSLEEYKKAQAEQNSPMTLRSKNSPGQQLKKTQKTKKFKISPLSL